MCASASGASALPPKQRPVTSGDRRSASRSSPTKPKSKSLSRKQSRQPLPSSGAGPAAPRAACLRSMRCRTRAGRSKL